MKEPLNYRNIFTITRYIDNLDEKINHNKICMLCFCKKNEKKCMMNCNCHSAHNIYNVNNVNENSYSNIKSKNKIRKSSLKKYNTRTHPIDNGKENNDINGKVINKNIYSFDMRNNNINAESDECQESETFNASNISEHNLVNEIHINKTSNYF